MTLPVLAGGGIPLRGSLVVLGLALMLPAGCYRAKVLPTVDEEYAIPLSEPRLVDHADVPLDEDPTQTYHVGLRDKLKIDVRKDPDLSGSYEVNLEGEIFLPLIGTAKVEGLTTEEIEELLTEKLSQYIREPDVHVGMEEYNSKLIYVIGQVRQPGPLRMEADALTLRQAVFGAGLPTPDAALKRCHVISPDYEDPVVYQIDLSEVLYQGKMRENILLRPDDIVYLPAKYATNISNTIRELLRPIRDVEDLQRNRFLGDEDYYDSDRYRDRYRY
ncbi:MAG TPA: polysaccharide biosynthesis/export family protein [Candidatus Sumerlaeota bacterium]|nr:polysaccharide biosynthesis/export family protein [Candidatus Sumerlaeota bacterium]HOR28651.1 polysaccharide biosynthesis/export family protein [Candidatus Sumerlaeota bacterium]HPK02279.1 polysaccharide biosynthesis/export family protein [Candidatus Sumerlaeota bacterium]